jgi:hypothetical protein
MAQCYPVDGKMAAVKSGEAGFVRYDIFSVKEPYVARVGERDVPRFSIQCSTKGGFERIESWQRRSLP